MEINYLNNLYPEHLLEGNYCGRKKKIKEKINHFDPSTNQRKNCSMK